MEQSCGIIPIKPHRGSFLFLLIQHRAGHWGFPKGHVEAGETAVQTAVRELTEETGLELKKIYPGRRFVEKDSYVRSGKTRHKVVIYYLGVVERGAVKIQKSEIKNFVWLPFDRALEKLPFIEIKKILRASHQYLKRPTNATA